MEFWQETFRFYFILRTVWKFEHYLLLRGLEQIRWNDVFIFVSSLRDFFVVKITEHTVYECQWFLVSFPKFYEILFDLLKSSLMAFRLYLLGTHDDQWGVSLVSFLNTADVNLLLAIIFVSKNFSGLISQVSFMFWWKLFRNWKSLSGIFFFCLVKISSTNHL